MTSDAIAGFTQEQGMFELSMLNAETSYAEFEEVIIEGIKRGIPTEILTRLKDLWEVSKEVAGEVVAIGKIIVMAIIDFMKANPMITVGLILGAALSTLVLGIPFLGPLLLPLTMGVSALYGAGVGAAMQGGDYSGSPISAAIALAKKFFELLRMILMAVSDYWKS